MTMVRDGAQRCSRFQARHTLGGALGRSDTRSVGRHLGREFTNWIGRFALQFVDVVVVSTVALLPHAPYSRY